LPPHIRGKRLLPGPSQNMEMVGHERPGIDDQITVPAKGGQAINKVLPVCLVPEYLRPFDTSPHHMMQGTGASILACLGMELNYHSQNLPISIFFTNVPRSSLC